MCSRYRGGRDSVPVCRSSVLPPGRRRCAGRHTSRRGRCDCTQAAQKAAADAGEAFSPAGAPECRAGRALVGYEVQPRGLAGGVCHLVRGCDCALPHPGGAGPLRFPSAGLIALRLEKWPGGREREVMVLGVPDPRLHCRTRLTQRCASHRYIDYRSPGVQPDFSKGRRRQGDLAREACQGGSGVRRRFR